MNGVRAALERRPAWPAQAQVTLAGIAAIWGTWYHLEFDGTAYKATRADGEILPRARTPEHLESAIRADFARWGAR